MSFGLQFDLAMTNFNIRLPIIFVQSDYLRDIETRMKDKST